MDTFIAEPLSSHFELMSISDIFIFSFTFEDDWQLIDSFGFDPFAVVSDCVDIVNHSSVFA